MAWRAMPSGTALMKVANIANGGMRYRLRSQIGGS